MSKLEINILSGSGNIFSVIDNLDSNYSFNDVKQNIDKLCNLGKYKTEGVILLNNGIEKYDFTCDFLNPDGSSGMMCGNGGRAILFFAKGKSLFNHKAKFRLSGIDYSGTVEDDYVMIKFPPPLQFIDNIEIETSFGKLSAAYVNVGTDHCVINANQLPNKYDINIIGKEIRHHKMFGKRGANANFYEVKNRDLISIRTFERGVEAETGACGTGAISTALITNLRNETNNPLMLLPTSQSQVKVEFIGGFPNKIENICYSGKVELLEKIILEF